MSDSDVEHRNPITEIHGRLRKASNTTMPRHRYRQVGRKRGKNNKNSEGIASS